MAVAGPIRTEAFSALGAPDIAPDVQGRAAVSTDLATVTIRSPSSADSACIAAMWHRCGAATRLARFHAPVRHFPASHLDAVLADPAASAVATVTGTVVGVASLIRCGEADAAELGVLVEDAWQRRGIGRSLVSHLLRRAPARGITVLTASVLACNEHIATRLRHIPGHYTATMTGPTLQVRVQMRLTKRGG